MKQDKTPVLNEGIRNTIFRLPQTDLAKKIQSLKDDVENLKPKSPPKQQSGGKSSP